MKYIFSTKNEFFYNENLSLHVDHYFSTQWSIIFLRKKKIFYISVMKNSFYTMRNILATQWKIFLLYDWNFFYTIKNIFSKQWKIFFYKMKKIFTQSKIFFYIIKNIFHDEKSISTQLNIFFSTKWIVLQWKSFSTCWSLFFYTMSKIFLCNEKYYSTQW